MQCDSRQLLFLLTAAILLMFAHSAALPNREIDGDFDDVLSRMTGASHDKNGQPLGENMDTSSVQSETVRHCQNSNPCGWAIYNQFSRLIDYYMKGSCTCPEGKQCLRAEEDVSVAAYVYRCR